MNDSLAGTGSRRTVVLVDAYAPALPLAEALTHAGCDVVRLRSSPGVPAVYRTLGTDGSPLPDGGLPPGPYVAELVHSGDLDRTVGQVAQLSPDLVLPGGELGVELADAVSEALGLAGNGTVLSSARRDKHRQVETVRAAGLRAARQRLVHDVADLRRWHHEIGGRIVVKPRCSAGNDHVAFCDTPDEAVTALEAIGSTENIFSLRNDGALAQEFLTGTEYVVNTVSRNGRHRATDVWRYQKISANGVRDRISAAVSVPPDAPEREELVRYAFDVLDALAIRHGPAHHEIMLTDAGPCLVEVGARLCGADTATYALVAGGESQLERTVQAYLEPSAFTAQIDAPHRVLRHVAMAFLTSPVTGTLRSYPLLPQVEALESFHRVLYAVRPGGHLPLTVDDTTEPMTVILAHPRREVVLRDLATVTWLDGHGFYELEPAAVAS